MTAVSELSKQLEKVKVQIKIPVFQKAEQIKEDEMYINVQNAANEVFRAQYKEEMSEYAPQMHALTSVWESTQKKISDTELNARIDIVIEWQEKRTAAVEALKKIEDAYAKAILYCNPPALDENTILILKKMNSKVLEIESRYVTLFHENIQKMQHQKERVRNLSQLIQDAYQKLKLSLETDAYYLKGSYLGVLSYAASWGGTPYVDKLRDARKEENKRVQLKYEEHKEKA